MNNPKFAPYFSNCLGALDGTHVDMHLPAVNQPCYRNKKQGLSQNVLAVCNFEMEFTFVLPGWEGSAHNVRVLQDAQSNHGFITPSHRYWLGDAGYSNSEHVLVPYQGTKYHLKEQQRAGLK